MNKSRKEWTFAAIAACLSTATLVLAAPVLDGGASTPAVSIVTEGVSPGRPGCASCHLRNGAGQPDVGIPRLAGLTSSYLADQLSAFAAGTRKNTAMSPYAAMLTPAERVQVANYFASLPIPDQPDLATAPRAQLDRGRSLFLDGNYRTGLLSCSQCHGQTGLGVGDFSPRLAGQSAAYVAAQLADWHGGAMRDPRGAFMRAEASHLSPHDISDLSVFIASLGNEKVRQP